MIPNNVKRKIPSYLKKFQNIKSIDIQPTDKKDKKYKAIITDKNGKIKTIHFGYKDSYTWSDFVADGKPSSLRDEMKKKKYAYKARASKIINKQGEYTYLIPETANSLAYWLLW